MQCFVIQFRLYGMLTTGQLRQLGIRHSAPLNNLFPVLLAAGEKVRDSLDFDAVADLDEYSTHKEEELWSYIAHRDSVANQRMENADTRRRLVVLFVSLFFAFTWGRGTRVDEQAGLYWLSLGARLGNWALQALFCLFEETAEQRLSTQLPRKLWSAISLLRGQEYAGGHLEAQDPFLHAFVLRKAELGGLDIHREGSPATVDGEPSGPATDPHGLYGAEKKTTLHIHASNGDVVAVQRLLDAGADINATTTHNETPIFQALRCGKAEVAKLLYERGAACHYQSADGYSALHLLCSIDDSGAAELAPLLVKRGAQLNSAAKEQHEDPGLGQCHVKGIPVSWAGIKGRPLFFEALVVLHCMPAHRLSVGRYFSLLQVLSKLHQHQMLSLVIAKETLLINADLGLRDITSTDDAEVLLEWGDESGLLSGSDVSPSAFSSLRSHEYHRALKNCLDGNIDLAIHNRRTHRTAFRQAKSNTIKLLLASGADPASPPNSIMRHENALYYAIVAKDTVAFRLFIEHMKANNVDILAVMSDRRRFIGCNALQRAINNDARGIFLLLIEMYPSLVQQANSAGFTALHMAVRQKWPEYTQDLLRQGASPHATAGNGLRPLVIALVNNPGTRAATEIADALLKAGEKQMILGPDDKTGNTAFGDLLASSPLNADRVRHFIDNYGPHDYYTNASASKTVFLALLTNHALPSNFSALCQRSRALEMLIEAFPDKINEVVSSPGGFILTPLQIAAWFGNVESVKVLVQKGAELELEADSNHPGNTVIRGHTAIGLALLRKHWGAPECVSQGGRHEIQVFSRKLQSVIGLLVQSGSRTAGRGANSVVRMDLQLAINPESGRIVKMAQFIIGKRLL